MWGIPEQRPTISKEITVETHEVIKEIESVGMESRGHHPSADRESTPWSLAVAPKSTLSFEW
jgi:hypothetical protein